MPRTNDLSIACGFSTLASGVSNLSYARGEAALGILPPTSKVVCYRIPIESAALALPADDKSSYTQAMRFRDVTELPDEDIDLGRAALLLAKIEAPDLDVDTWLERLDELGAAVRDRAVGAASDYQRLDALTKHLYGEMGFRGNSEDYYDPRNSFLDQVLERRLGIPISLAVLLMEVGRRADIPLFGVGLPGHFLVRHARHVELVLDPFDRGRILTRVECAKILERVFGDEASLEEKMLRPVGPRHILARMHHNLRAIYFKRRDLKKAARVIDRLVRLEPDVPRHLYDRGVLHLHASDPQGIEDLERYLAEEDEAPDREEIEATLKRARRKLLAVH